MSLSQSPVSFPTKACTQGPRQATHHASSASCHPRNQEVLDPHIVDGIPGTQNPSLFRQGPVGSLVSTAASSHCQSSHLYKDGTSQLTWPPACHPHGNRSIPTLVHTSLPGLGAWFSREGQTKKSWAQVTSLSVVPQWMLRGAGAGSAVASRDVPSVGLRSPRPRAAGGGVQGGSGDAGLRGLGLTLLRCGSRVSR